MGRPESERRYLRQAVKEGLLTVDHATTIIAELERRRESGLHAIRDIAIRTGKLTEKLAYALFHRVSKEMREVPPNLRRVNGFEVLGPLGKGSMSVVFKARQVSLDKIVALKVLPPGLSEDPVFQERFLREARAAAKLNHPNVVAALDAGRADGYHYFAMEYVDGSTVRDIVTARGPIDEREALKVAYFVARALKHAHAAGILHRDVKPANIMLTRDGKVKLTDLGLAKIENDPQESHLTEVGKSVGTPYYMSPEQARRGRTADARSDIYALGATLFYMLTGRPPFDGETPSLILEKHVRAPVPDPRSYEPEIDERTSVVVRRALEKRPESRYQTPGEMAQAIKAVLQGRSPNTPDPDADPLPSARSGRITTQSGRVKAQSGRHRSAGARSGEMPPVPRTSPAGELPSLPSLPSLPALPPLPGGGTQWPQGAPLYVAAAPAPSGSTSGRRKAVTLAAAQGGAVGMSSMTLTPVWLDPVTGKSSLSQMKAARRRVGARRKEESSVPLIVSLVVALVGVTAGALIATSGGKESEAAKVGKGTERARAARASPDEPGASRPSGAGGTRRAGAGARPLSLDEEMKARAEALDRAEAERLAKDPVAAEAARLAREAARSAAEAKELARRAKEEEEKRAKRAAEELEKGIARETRDHASTLAEVAQRLKEEDVAGALRLLDAAVARYGTQAVRARAELDLAGVRAIERLEKLARGGLERRLGEKERLAFAKGITLEGEVLELTDAGEVVVKPAAGGRFSMPVRDLTLFEQRRLARLGLPSEKQAEVYAAEGLLYLYTGEREKARRRLELALEQGSDVKVFLDRLAEMAGAAGASSAAADPAPGKEVAGGPAAPAGPSGGAGTDAAPAGGSAGGARPEEDDDWEKADPTPSSGSAGASPGAGEEKKPEGREKGPPPVERLTEEICIRIFEIAPKSFLPDGFVHFQYGLMESKRLPGDFALEGGDLRYDVETSTLRLEGPARRITHKAVFTGGVKLEAQLAFVSAPSRSSALVLFAEEAGARGSALESVFGIDLSDRRKGKVVARSGPIDPFEVAIRETKTMMGYRFHLEVEPLSLAGVDGATRARLEGVEVEGKARRVGLAAAGVNAQLRGIDISGRLDLGWVARELAKKPVLGR
jgi:serine/threonine-protein kinase